MEEKREESLPRVPFGHLGLAIRGCFWKSEKSDIVVFGKRDPIFHSIP
jgi:hypothetical protein